MTNEKLCQKNKWDKPCPEICGEMCDLWLREKCLLKEKNQFNPDYDATAGALSDAQEAIGELQARIEVLNDMKNKYHAELAALKQAVLDEPELPGEMPDEMWDAIKGDRDAITEALRIVIRQTKAGILERAIPPLPEKGGQNVRD